MIEFKEIISILLNPMTSFMRDNVTKVITVVKKDKKPEKSRIVGINAYEI
jgi:hypothetical protein